MLKTYIFKPSLKEIYDFNTLDFKNDCLWYTVPVTPSHACRKRSWLAASY